VTTRPATTTIVQRRWTQAEYRRLPEGPPYYRLEDGALIEWPHRSGTHQQIVGELGSLLSRYLKRQPLGEIWPGVEVDLSPTRTYIPDLSFLLKANLDRFANDIAIQGPPDLVVEVIAPTTATRDKGQKLRAYHTAGVPWYWLVETESLLITEYKHTADGYLVSQITPPADSFAPAPFPGLSFRMADLFGEQNVEEDIHE